MRIGRFSPYGIKKLTVDHENIECSRPAHQSKYLTPNGCIACAQTWLNSLPIYRPGEPEDDFLKIEFDIPDNLEWCKRLTKLDGDGWQGYTAESFGPRLGEVADPEDYPYWRIPDAANPNAIIRLLRMRVCYEPQKETVPIFLELLYYGFNIKSAIRGMDGGIEVGPQELAPLLRVRNLLLGLSGGSPLNSAIARRGRPKEGSGSFASDETFLIALREVLAGSRRTLSQPRALERLSRHPLWTKKPLSLKECQGRTRTLRNWLTRCGLDWETAKAQHCQPNTENKSS